MSDSVDTLEGFNRNIESNMELTKLSQAIMVCERISENHGNSIFFGARQLKLY